MRTLASGPRAVYCLTAILCAGALTGCGGATQPAVEVRVAGHNEALVADDGTLTPVFIESRLLLAQPTIRLCFQGELDPTAWMLAWSYRQTGETPSERSFEMSGELTAPVARLERTACYEIPSPASHDPQRALKLCWRVRDGGKPVAGGRGCLPLVVRSEDAQFDELLLRNRELRRLATRDPEERRARFEELAADAWKRGYPLSGTLARQLGAFLLRLEQAYPQALQLLDADPLDWTRTEVERGAAGYAALSAETRAQIDLDAGWDLRGAWQGLRRASRLKRSIIHPQRYTVAMTQAELLSRLGATREAIDLLRGELATCDWAPCAHFLLPDAQLQLHWLTVLYLEATNEELSAAEGDLANIVADETGALSSSQRAVGYINLAHLRIRLGHDPLADLTAARALLASDAENQGAARSQLYLAWADVVEGLAALEAGAPQRALRLCRRSAAADSSAQLSGLAASCSGQAERRLGRLEAAYASFERAVERHRFSSTRGLDQQIDLGPGQRAEDSYRAARLAVELGRPEEAWERMTGLDAMATDEQLRIACRQQATDAASRARWRALDQRERELFEQLVALDAPLPPSRRQQVADLRTQLRRELQELSRVLPGCDDRSSGGTGDRFVGWRMFALEDEVILLERTADGRIVAHRRAADRRQLLQAVAALSEALVSRQLSDEQWRQQARPLAAALIPPHPEALGDSTRFALHGFLQGVPLAALPVNDLALDDPALEDSPLDARAAEGPPVRRWLADWTTPVLQPALGATPAAGAATVTAGGLDAAGQPRAEARRGTAHGLFVIDPEDNLPSAPEASRAYRRQFPSATLLRGEAATEERFAAALQQADFLHLDAHADFDPAFPELSSLRLRGGPLPLSRLAALPNSTVFANLSGCATGRWPTTADAGRFGMAGVFARAGSAWVIASRAVIGDRLARDFNLAFYRSLSASVAAGGGTASEPAFSAAVPTAFAAALRQLRQTHDAAEWAALLLLSGRERAAARQTAQRPATQGQSNTATTPDGAEAVPFARGPAFDVQEAEHSNEIW